MKYRQWMRLQLKSEMKPTRGRVRKILRMANRKPTLRNQVMFSMGFYDELR